MARGEGAMCAGYTKGPTQMEHRNTFEKSISTGNLLIRQPAPARLSVARPVATSQTHSPDPTDNPRLLTAMLLYHATPL